MPDLSFHEDSGLLPVSQDQRTDTSLPQPGVQIPDAGPGEQASKPEMLSPHHRLLLSLARPEEQRYLAASVDPGSTEALYILGRILTRERTCRKQRSALLITVAILLGIGGAAFISTLSNDKPGSVTLGSAVALVLLSLLAIYNPISRLEQAAFEYLLYLDDRRSVGLLLEQRNVVALTDQHRVNQALTRLLPEIDPGEASQLTSAQRNQLHSILGYVYPEYDPDLRLAAVAAMARIGDRRDLGTLYAVAAAMAATKGEQAVRTAAQKCLHDLQARLDFGKVESIPDYLKRICTPVTGQANSQTVFYFVDADSLYALISLLPQLTATNYRQILPQQVDRDRLYSLLGPAAVGSYSFDKLKLYREIVRTLERVGDTKSMHALRQVAKMEAPTDGARQLRAAANAALQILRQQFEKEKVGKTLLRASFAPDIQPDELLRPSAPAESATDPNELLRASIPQKEHGPITPASLAKAMEALRRQSQEDDGA
ncbi:MAG: hypothetical protein JWL77_1210 [Chthonomonadaceae bacterium]|nr:hypothetical protein [Chthonomonadaceae bacterium]